MTLTEALDIATKDIDSRLNNRKLYSFYNSVKKEEYTHGQ